MNKKTNSSHVNANSALQAQPYRLFLDDKRDPYEVGNYMLLVKLREEYMLYQWVIVRNYPEFVRCIIENGLPTHISFDHDLSDDHYNSGTGNDKHNYNGDRFKNDLHKTGYHCAKWLCEYLSGKNLSLPICYVHSMSPIGKENIEKLLKCFQKNCL